MTAIGNPTAALRACIDALTPTKGAEEANAVTLAATALRGQPFPAASLETAACIWEAVLDMERDGDTRSADDMQEAQGAAIRAAREAMGSSALRMTALSWVPDVDAAWLAADTDNGREPLGGQYGDSFDWAFVPGWIARNIDWSNPHCPTRRREARIPLMAPGDKIVTRSPLDDLTPDLRAWLVDDMGMTAEIMGGGAFGLNHAGPDGSYILVTSYGGGGMPTADSWHVGAYLPNGDGDGVLSLTSEHEGRAGVSLEMAVGAACGVLADFTAPPIVAKRFDVSLTLTVSIEVTARDAAAAKSEALRVTDLMSPDAALDGWNSVSSAEGRPTIDDVRFDIEGDVEVHAIDTAAQEA